jgi:hypothetical protein
MNIKGVVAFIKGIGLSNIRAAIYAWIFNLLVSVFVYWGFYSLFANASGDSVVAKNVTQSLGVFTFIADISRNHDGNLSVIIAIALLAAVLYFLISIFLAGGIFSALVGDERTTFANLMVSSIENFFKMCIMFAVNLLNLLAAAIIPGLLMLIFIKTKSYYLNETVMSFFIYAWSVLTVLFLIFSVAIYDFSRIFKLKDERSPFHALKKAIKFSFANKWNILSIFLLYGLSLVVLYLFYTLFINIMGGLLYAVLLFIAFQGFVLVRYYLKIVVMRAEVSLLL